MGDTRPLSGPSPLKRRKSLLEAPIYPGFNEFEEPHIVVALLTYISYAFLIIFGHLRDFMRRTGLETSRIPKEKGNVVCPHRTLDAVCRPKTGPSLQGFVPLFADFESFYTRNLYRRIRDCWNRPITGVPGGFFDILERMSDDGNWTFRYAVSLGQLLTGNWAKVHLPLRYFRLTNCKLHCLNLGSYNYLGFANNKGLCAEKAVSMVEEYGVCPRWAYPSLFEA